jgi:hypothetical protein
MMQTHDEEFHNLYFSPLLGEIKSAFKAFVGKFEVTKLSGRSRRTVLKLKRTIFWDVTPCRPLKVNRRFGGSYCLHYLLGSNAM